MNNTIAITAAPGLRKRVAVASRQARKPGRGIWAVILCAVHTPLALAIYNVEAVALLHALATLAVGLFLALAGRRRLLQVAYWGAYVAGVEVLWRMAKAPVFWEYGKYATALVLMLALVRSQLFKGQLLPVAYFALLIPSVILTFLGLEVEAARAQVSFNLSGPFALMASAVFFSRLRLTVENVKKLLLAMLIPTVGIAVITLFSTAAAVDSNMIFGENSNTVTSGGFGPNQVSATLGLGALAAWIVISTTKSKLWLKLFLFAAMGLVAVQSALTFSRGGLYNAAGGALLGAVFLMKDSRARLKIMLMVAAVIVIGLFVVLPRLQSITDGALGSRFANTDPSKRADIALADLEIWRDNPVLGVGPGLAKGTRSQYYEEAGSNGAHTEFTRLLSEHGLFGFCALVLFIAMSVNNLKRARTAKGKAFIAAMIGWSFLYMANAAMRLVAPAFVFGVTFATFLPEARTCAKGVATGSTRAKRRSAAGLAASSASGGEPGPAADRLRPSPPATARATDTPPIT